MSGKTGSGISKMSDSFDGSSEKRKRKIRFVPLPSTSKFEVSFHHARLWSPEHGLTIRTSLYLWLAIGLLFISNVLYVVSFLTNGWGVLLVGEPSPVNGTNTDNLVSKIIGVKSPSEAKSSYIMNSMNSSVEKSFKSKDEKLFTENERYWEFGLWECCRNDGFCLGTRWPMFYGVTRAFCVLALLGQILTLGWMIGHALENLLEYDPCSMGVLISLNASTAIFVLIAVCAFGTRWPVEFRNDFHGTDTYLSYSFYLAVTCCVLLTASTAFAVVELVTSWKKMKSYSRRGWATADEILGDEDDDEGDGIEEQSYHSISYM